MKLDKKIAVEVFIIIVVLAMAVFTLLSSPKNPTQPAPATYCLQWVDEHGFNPFTLVDVNRNCYNQTSGLYSCAWEENETTHILTLTNVSLINYNNQTFAHINWTQGKKYNCSAEVYLK